MKTLRKKKSSHRFQALPLQPTVMVVGALAAAFDPASALAQRPLGVDVSSYQGAPNWSTAHGNGVVFAWAKATEGTSITDPDFTYNQSNGKAAGVYMGAYHFAHPNSASPGTEENHFWAVASGYVKADGKTLMPTLDFEVFSGVTGASSYSDWANQFCSNVKSDAAAQGVSVQPVLYTSACSACNFNSSVSQWHSWIANYNGENLYSGNPWNVCTSCEVWGSGAWDCWQVSSGGAVGGISGNVDLDTYNGTTSGMVSKLVVKANASWRGWSSLGGTLTSHPTACSYQANQIDVYVRSTDNQIWQMNWNGSAWWANWVRHTALPSGVTAAGAPAAAANNEVSGREDLYVIGSDGNCWHDWWVSGTGWGGWQNLGQPSGVSLRGAPAATSWAAGRYDVVAVGSNGHTYHKYYNGSWSGWEDLSGSTSYDPTACSWGANRLDIYVNGSGPIWHKYWDGSWNGWGEDLPEITTSYALGASSWGSGRIDLFANDGGLIRHNWYNGGWAPNWNESHPGVTATSAACSTSWGFNRIDVFVQGSDNACWHMWWGE